MATDESLLECPLEGTAADGSGELSLGEAVGRLDNRWLILGTLVLAVGAAGLPLLWRSRAFSTPAKVGWSVVICVETIVWWAGLFYVLSLAVDGMRYAAAWVL